MRKMWKKLLPALLAAALLCGCGVERAPETPEQPEQPEVAVRQEVPETPAVPELSQEEPEEAEPPREEPVTEAPAQEPSEPEPEPDAVSSATPEDAPPPVEPEEAVISDTPYTCTISISCASVLEHMDALEDSKQPLIPEDGWVLAPTAITFYEGESVFNVLQRTCKQLKIHLEFEDTPLYNSAYIEGIHNLYEFDCGNLSGWVYSVNGWRPNYGCSRYQLQDGDVICWEYTCDLGRDVNGYTTAAQET